ncbi:MAG TPA: hypothetical protein VGN88_06975, partial [Phycisphaerae bacterium]
MSQSAPSLSEPKPPPPLQIVRIPVDKPQPAVAFLQARSRGVMDLIAHFWERLAHTPPLQRQDLHLVVAIPAMSINKNINMSILEDAQFSGAMLYVPKAHRADVMALDQAAAAAFAAYITQEGPKVMRSEGAPSVPGILDAAVEETAAIATNVPPTTAAAPSSPAGGVTTLPLTDLSSPMRNGGADAMTLPSEPPPPAMRHSSNGKVPIDFLTGDAQGIAWMTPLLLPIVHKRTPARQLVNVVMQLPVEIKTEPDPHVRFAQDVDVPMLNRWRRQYKEERGILFDADMDAWVENKRVFVYELPESAAKEEDGTAIATTSTHIVAVAKIDLELQHLMEIGGVYTFPEHR